MITLYQVEDLKKQSRSRSKTRTSRISRGSRTQSSTWARTETVEGDGHGVYLGQGWSWRGLGWRILCGRPAQDQLQRAQPLRHQRRRLCPDLQGLRVRELAAGVLQCQGQVFCHWLGSIQDRTGTCKTNKSNFFLAGWIRASFLVPSYSPSKSQGWLINFFLNM